MQSIKYNLTLQQIAVNSLRVLAYKLLNQPNQEIRSRPTPHPCLLLLRLLLRLRLRFWFRVWQRANEFSQNVSHSSACTLTKHLYALILYIRQFEGYSLLLGCHIPLSIS